tara:strand:+ start:380 stop:706 length:327 start_codon:yes stop_codon:yes gene_type:complete
MSAKKINIEIEQGATFSYEVELLNANGAAFDVTGYTGSGMLRKHEKSNTHYDFIVALSTGEIVFSMTANTTNAIPSGLFLYDVKIVSSDDTKRVIGGMATVTGQIART